MPTKGNIADMTCGNIGHGILALTKRSFMLVVGLVVTLLIWIQFTDPADAWPVTKMCFGVLVIVWIWHNQPSPGLPIILIVGLQTIAVYAIPMIMDNEAIEGSTPEQYSAAATEVMIYGVALALGWKLGSNRPPAKTIHPWIFTFIDGGGAIQKLARLSILLLGGTLVFQIGLRADFGARILATLPTGVGSILQTLSEATAMGGGILGGFVIGSGKMPQITKGTYWVLFTCLYAFLISGFLLSTATGLICASTLGLLIGKRSLPTAFLVSVVSVSSFFNLTKFDMREKYWDYKTGALNQTLDEIPEQLLEWSQLSITKLTSGGSGTGVGSEQRLSNRVNNLSILLFVQDAVTERKIPLLAGATYTLIPELLIPRLFWPNKPRAHAGQELLNVHFGRQSLEETFNTYIAWGLLAEAYGNFGPFWGATIFGIALGFVLGRVEAWSRPFPLKSLQTFLILAFAVRVGTAFEMVASVFVTSTFQQLVAIGAASFILIRKTRQRPGPPGPNVISAQPPDGSASRTSLS